MFLVRPKPIWILKWRTEAVLAYMVTILKQQFEQYDLIFNTNKTVEIFSEKNTVYISTEGIKGISLVLFSNSIKKED